MSKEKRALIAQMEPWFDEHEASAVYEYMKGGGWVTEFRKTREFEQMIAEFTGAQHCSVVCNGTVSLLLALVACGVGPGDEVIVPDYTMVATPNAVRLAGAEVIFADISPDSLCLDFDAMKGAVSPRTKAIMLVTVNGRYPNNLEDYIDFCRKKGIRVIEDAAQSLGSFKSGRHLGTFGDIGSFSFSAPKIITTGQGGALVTNDATLIQRVRLLRDFGRSSGGSDHYLTMGWNFKFTDIQAVIGIEQMKKLPWRLARKKELYALYRFHLEGTPGIFLIPTALDDTAPWFFDILVSDGLREPLVRHLGDGGIGTRPFYPALHSEPVYALAKEFPVADRIARQGLWLPSSSWLTDETVETVCDEIKSFMYSQARFRDATIENPLCL
jgi:perosamine synthetase